MASTRCLLVLWLLPWLRRGEAWLLAYKPQSMPGWTSQSISYDGVYILSVRADPFPDHNLELRLYYWSYTPFSIHNYIFTAYGQKVIGTAEVAISLRSDDMVLLKSYGRIRSQNSLSVAYVSNRVEGFCRTAGVTGRSSSPILYSKMFMVDIWENLSQKKTSFVVPATGIFWVTMRPNTDGDPITVNVINEGKDKSRFLFDVYTKQKKAISCSAAFYLINGSTIKTTLSRK